MFDINTVDFACLAHYVNIFEKKGGCSGLTVTMQLKPCRRCGGTGYTMYHPDGGVCYRCWGRKDDPSGGMIVKSIVGEPTVSFQLFVEKKLEGVKRRAAAKEAKLNAKKKAEAEAWKATVAADPVLSAAFTLRDDEHFSGFARNVLESIEQYRRWSEKQHAVLEKELVKVEERRNAAAERERKSEFAEYYGEVGGRFGCLVVQVKRVMTFAGDWGNYDMLILEDDVCHAFKWSTSTKHDLKEGDWVTLSGRIKSHTEYKGLKQTVLGRCKVIEKR